MPKAPETLLAKVRLHLHSYTWKLLCVAKAACVRQGSLAPERKPEQSAFLPARNSPSSAGATACLVVEGSWQAKLPRFWLIDFFSS